MAPFRIHSSLVLLSFVCTLVTTVADRCQDLDLTMSMLEGQRLFAGMAFAMKGDKVQWSRGYGQAVPELKVPMQNNHVYPIGSNTKLFTAVAIWQLHQQGELNLSDPVGKYIVAEELGLEGPWCPQVAEEGPCEMPRIHQLLSMSAGMPDYDNCHYPEGAWQRKYCLGASQGPNMTFMDASGAVQGLFNLPQTIRMLGFMKMPLDFKPGTSYHYANSGFTLAGYIVEKVSGMSYKHYLERYIFQPLGLNQTMYDLSNGANGLYMNVLPIPSYTSVLSPISIGQKVDEEVLVDDAGSVEFKTDAYISGDLGPAWRTLDPNGPPYGVWIKTLRGLSNSLIGYGDLFWANAAGAIYSTHADMGLWYRTLLRQPERLNLTHSALKELLTTGVPAGPSSGGNLTEKQKELLGRVHYVQGVVVELDPTHPLGVKALYYLGSIYGFEAVVYYEPHRDDPSQDVFMAVTGTTVLDVKSYGFTRHQDNRCVFDDSNVTRVDGPRMATLRGPVTPASAQSVPGAVDAAAGQLGRVDGASMYLVPDILCQIGEETTSGEVTAFVASRLFSACEGRRWVVSSWG